MSFNAAPAVVALHAWYNSGLGLYNWDDPNVPIAITVLDETQIWPGLVTRFEDTDRWWEDANALGALIDYMSTTGDRTYLSVVDTTFNNGQTAFGLDTEPGHGQPHLDVGHVDVGHVDVSAILHGDFNAPHFDTSLPHVDVAIPTKLPYTNFLNNFYDDEGWWALSWTKAYDLTRDAKYLDMAQTIFADMAGGWDDTFGGGIYWSKDKADSNNNSPYKNAISNELFMAVAARLYLRGANGAPAFPGTTDTSYKTWALNACNWFVGSGLIGTLATAVNDSQHHIIPNMINDSLNTQGVNDGTQAFWTYNHGIILGALCDISIITGSQTYRVMAEQIAEAAINYFSAAYDGILTEVNDDPNGYTQDSCIFKGPFIRNLAVLYANDHNPAYSSFITNNATTVLANGNASSQFGARWQSSPDTVDFMRQAAAIDCINAANKAVLAAEPISLKATLAFVGQKLPVGIRQVIGGVTSSAGGWAVAVTT